MKRIVLLFALGACSPSESPSKIEPRGTCGAPCNSSTQCSDFFGSCRICWDGFCTNTLPASPTSVDAGVDADTKSTGAVAP